MRWSSRVGNPPEPLNLMPLVTRNVSLACTAAAVPDSSYASRPSPATAISWQPRAADQTDAVRPLDSGALARRDGRRLIPARRDGSLTSYPGSQILRPDEGRLVRPAPLLRGRRCRKERMEGLVFCRKGAPRVPRQTSPKHRTPGPRFISGWSIAHSYSGRGRRSRRGRGRRLPPPGTGRRPVPERSRGWSG